METATVIICAYNAKKYLSLCLEMVRPTVEVHNIIIIDNGSSDGCSEWLMEQPLDYIIFDEGMQGYGKALNTALNHYEIGKNVIFMNPRYVPSPNCIRHLIETLREDNCGIASIMSNGCPSPQYCPMEKAEDMIEKEQSGGRTFETIAAKDSIWGIRKEVLEKNGLFDEEIVSPDYVLMDYSLCLVKNGYKNLVSPWAVAYDICAGRVTVNYEKLLGKSDLNTMKLKWNMNYFNVYPNNNLIELIDKAETENFRVLEVGCDLGATLLEIKHLFPNSQIYGLELEKAAAQIAQHFAEVKEGDIEKCELPFEEAFDYIIFGDVLEHLHDPQKVIGYCREKLKPNGCILSCIPNLMHISVMEQLLKGRFSYGDRGLLDRTHIHFFTYYEMILLFQERGFQLEWINFVKMEVTEEQEKLIKGLTELSGQLEPFMLEAFQFIVRARRRN